MREIKFRAWDETNKKMWQSGDDGEELNGYTFRTYFNSEGLHAIIHGQAFKVTDDPFPMYDCEQIHLELMQYTGSKDRNGYKIYEGDIVRYRLDGHGYRFCVLEVEYLEKQAGFYLTQTNEGKKIAVISMLNADKSCEVIGNIYENPELMEV